MVDRGVDMRKLLITGGSGFVGGTLIRMASASWDTYATFCSSEVEAPRLKGVLRMDLARRQEVESVVGSVRPDVIIHTAAMSRVAECCGNPELAHAVNVAGTESIVQAAESIGARLVHVSTDMVFDGEKGRYTEDDSPNPLSAYGRTKYESEQRVAAAKVPSCIARTALIYGLSHGACACFAQTMLSNLVNSRPVTLYTDEYRSPVLCSEMCSMLLEMADNEDLHGLYHVCGPERVSRYTFGQSMCEVFGLPEDGIVTASADSHGGDEPRPKDCSLVNTRQAEFQTRCCGVTEGLQQMKTNLARHQA